MKAEDDLPFEVLEAVIYADRLGAYLSGVDGGRALDKIALEGIYCSKVSWWHDTRGS